MKAGHIEHREGISHRAALIAVCPDHDGLDEWMVSIFDFNGDQSEDLLDAEFPLTFRECTMKASDFAAANPNLLLRVVIERVC